MCLYVVGAESHRSFSPEFEPSSDPLRTLLHDIEQFRFPLSRPSNWQNQRVVIRTFEPAFNIPGLPQVITHIAYGIRPSDDQGKYGLKMDYALTEVLNERNDYRDHDGK